MRIFPGWLAAWVMVGSAAAKPYCVFFGTYTGTKDGAMSEGIYRAEFDSGSGVLSSPVLAAKMKNPSFLAIARDRSFLFAVGEVGEFAGKPSGMVMGFALDAGNGALDFRGAASSAGAGPCHVSVDDAGKRVLVANYSTGTVSSRMAEDGKLGEPVSVIPHKGSGPNAARQEKAHAHSIIFSPDGKRAYAADLGIDEIHIYQVGADAKLVPNDPPVVKLPPGSGPRHFTFHPDGKRAYVVNELHSTVTAFSCDVETGGLTATDSASTLPAPVEGNTTAEIVVHPNGRWLYVSNRGHDSIAVFGIEGEKLKPLGHVPCGGKTPRNFSLDPEGRWMLVANQGTNNVVVFKINRETGMPVPTGGRIGVVRPVCVRFVGQRE